MKYILLSFILMMQILSAGCSGTKTQTESDTRIYDIWALTVIKGKNVILAEAGGQQPYLEFQMQSGKFLGNTGCNEISGNIVLSGDEITFSNVGMTKIFCGDAKYEIDFVSIVKEGKLKYKIDNLKLTFSNDGKDLMVFKKVD